MKSMKKVEEEVQGGRKKDTEKAEWKQQTNRKYQVQMLGGTFLILSFMNKPRRHFSADKLGTKLHT